MATGPEISPSNKSFQSSGADPKTEPDLYQNLFNTMVQGVVHQDKDGRVISMNPAAIEILGRTPGEFLGRTSTDVEKDTIREDGTSFRGADHPAMVALRTGKRVHDVMMGVYNPRDKRHRWINVNAIPLFKPGSEEPYQVYTVFEDMTDKRQGDQELKRSEERYRSVVHSAPYGMQFYELRNDGSMIFTGANPSADRILNINHSDLVGKQIEEAFPGLPGTNIVEIYKQVARTGKGWKSEKVDYDHGNIKGAFEVFAFQTSPGHIVVSFADITERILATEKTDALLKKVEEEKDRFAALVNSMSDEVWFADNNKKFVLANPSARKEFALGESTNDIDIQKMADSMEVFRPDGTPRPPEEAPPLRALAGETVINMEEIVRVPSTGQLRYRQVSATPVRGEGGDVIGSVSVVRDITDRKNAEKVLKSTSEYLEKLFAYANAPIIVWDTSFRITRFNRAFERMTGLAAGEVIGKDLSILFPEGSKEESLELIAKTLSGERWESVEIPILRSDGSTRVALWNSANVYEEDGKTLAATIAQGQDITERKEAEAELQEYMSILERSNADLEIAKGRLETLISSMPVGVLITDTSGKFLVVNESLRKIWGGDIPLLQDFTEYSELKAWWADTGKQVTPDQWPVSEAMRSGTEITGHIFNIRRFDGTRGTIIASALPLRDADGKTVAGAAFAQDISELKRTEKTIREERNKLKFILNSLPVAVGVTDAAGRFVIINRHMNTIWGADMTRLDRTSATRWVGYDPKTGDHLRPEDWPIARAMRDVTTVGPTEIDIVGFDKKKRTILATALPMLAEDGRLTGGLVAYVDITSQKNVETELARSNAQLQNFAYVASHDLKEPLRTISGFLEILAMDYGNTLDDTAKDYISRAVSASMRLHNMIDDLLTFSRLETKRYPLSKVDLNNAVRLAVTDLSQSIHDHRAKVYSDSLPSVMVDEQQIATVFRNLIDNAVKFHGSEPPRVKISARRLTNAWEISFSDNGIGIDPAFYGKMFRMFTRLHTRKEYPGNGIGLAMCRKIIEAHGGRIWVESKAGLGATFSFTLPDQEAMTETPQNIESWAFGETHAKSGQLKDE
jgi:PAS domain S-box-containing protein